MINPVLTAANAVLNLALVAIGLYLANNLRRQLQLKVVDRRLESYSRLWAILRPAGPWRLELGGAPMSAVERGGLFDQMTDWYFAEGNGMLLKPVTRELYLNAKFNMICKDKELRLDPAFSDDELAEKPIGPERDLWRGRLTMRQLSLLRAQMRNDVAVFGDLYQERLENEDKAFLRGAGVNLRDKPWKSARTGISRQFKERVANT